MRKLITLLIFLFVAGLNAQTISPNWDSSFNAQGYWVLRNGSTISGGVLTVVAGTECTNPTPTTGSITYGNCNWSAEFPNITNIRVYETRRYRLTFDARQTVGSGDLQIGQRFNVINEGSITGTFQTYTYDFDGSSSNNAGNDLAFGGRTFGDTWEIQNMTLEDIGITSTDAESGLPGAIYLYTDFEAATYTYEQWGLQGQNPPERNQWEVDQPTPRTTDHVDAGISTGRDGTGRAIWLGSWGWDYIPDPYYDRNELGKDVAHPFGEWWTGFSFYVDNPMGNNRIMYQVRNLAPGGSSTVNAISLRQASNGTQLYFSLADDVTRVDQTEATLGTWNGAGTGTSSVFVDYNTGQWYDLVIHYKGAFGANYTGPDTSGLERNHFGYDPRSDGFVEVWLNGTKIIDQTGTTLYRYERRGGEIRNGYTPKFGTYWSNTATPIPGGTSYDIYYDNYKIWNGPEGTYADVDPNASIVGNIPVATAPADVVIDEGDPFTPSAGSWTDVEDGSGSIPTPTGAYDVNVPGIYNLTYSYTDTDGNTDSDISLLTVNQVTTGNFPVATAPANSQITVGDPFTPSAGSWTDVEDGSGSIPTPTGAYDVNTVGAYNLTYSYTDTDGNTDSDISVLTVVPVAPTGARIFAGYKLRIGGNKGKVYKGSTRIKN